jgi:hypothetical protein
MVLAEDENAIFHIIRDFNVNNKLPNPDIYFLMMDGMVGFNAIESFFGDSQNDLRIALESRGFVINDTAILYGGSTSYALPVMLAPSFYDSFYGEIISNPDVHRLPSQSNQGVYLALRCC